MYESPSLSPLIQDTSAGTFVANAHVMANGLAIANAAGYENALAATVGLVVGAVDAGAEIVATKAVY